METVRKPFQGVWNIMRFNWHFYVLAIIISIILFITTFWLPLFYSIIISVLILIIIITTSVSLLVSFYVYDLSKLYELNWLENDENKIQIVNINAGFDETSILLKSKYKNADLTVLDFYNPEKHTEISIKRARKAYPAYPNTKQISTFELNLEKSFADKIFLTFAAHEIRNEQERIEFFQKIYEILKPNGQIIVTEHLRDLPNFLAYTIGFFHFYSKSNWVKTFENANLKIKSEQKITPFISSFILIKNGNTP